MARLSWTALFLLALAAVPGAALATPATDFASAAADGAPLEHVDWKRAPHAGAAASFTAFAPRDLARGTLLRAKLNDNTSLTVRVRSRRIGLYLSVRLGD